MHRMTQDQLNEQLFEAVYANDIEAVKKAIADGANVNAQCDSGLKPLQYAQNTEIEAILKQHGGVA